MSRVSLRDELPAALDRVLVAETGAPEAPDLARFARAHPEVQLLGIDILDTKEGARDFYAEFDLPYPSVFDPRAEIALSFGLQGQPITYFLNERHEIVGRIIGGSDLAGLESALRTALA
ncbi:MAG: TlpA family protein disulfide reductase [Actinobacteria bacterium]|nr:TlpA family protein disulfide reductase [Actinomycetota bacterium]